MGSVFHKTATKKLPPDAEIFTRKGKRFARWTKRGGNTATAPVTVGRKGEDRIVIKARTYTAKYRDGAGVVVEARTGCRDKTAAKAVLAELERRADKVRSGIVSVREDAIADHQSVSLLDHIHAYLLHQEAEGSCEEHRANVRRDLIRVASECGFAKLGDLNRDAFEQWLAFNARAGMGARTRNRHRASLVAFCNWCVAADRLAKNPFSRVKKADEKADQRRQRRSLDEEELIRLLAVARQRPLLDQMTVRHGKNRGKPVAKLRPETHARLQRLGWKRALVYKTLVLTGLRRAELASLTVGQLELDRAIAYAVLAAADEKNREGSEIAIRADLAAELKEWLDDKLKRMQEEARQRDEPIPARLPAGTPVFSIPRNLVKVLNGDLKMAGIPKRDDRGRTVDVHALRHSFGTHLSKGGVSPRTAQAAMRHSTLDLTMNVYTDPRLLDVHGALDVLPALPLNGDDQAAEMATGTDGGSEKAFRKFAPGFAPDPDHSCHSCPLLTKDPDERVAREKEKANDVSRSPVNRKHPLSTADNGCPKERETGFEPATSSLGS